MGKIQAVFIFIPPSHEWLYRRLIFPSPTYPYNISSQHALKETACSRSVSQFLTYPSKVELRKGWVAFRYEVDG